MKTHDIILVAVIVLLVANSVRESRIVRTPPEARLGFYSELWGSHYWLTLHLSALNSPRENGTAMKDFEKFLHAIQEVLPCKMCREEFKLMLRTLPPRDFMRHGRIGAVAYVFVLHHNVSLRTGNPNQSIKFLEMERSLLENYTKPFACNIDKIMTDLHNDARDRGIYKLIETANRRIAASFTNSDQ